VDHLFPYFAPERRKNEEIDTRCVDRARYGGRIIYHWLS
jgi:hypothetical protein